MAHSKADLAMALAQTYQHETPLDMLSVHAKNPRLGDIDAIWESISANRFFGAVLALRHTGTILVGNHRYQAARRAGMTTIPVLWIEDALTEEEAIRILIGDNRTSDIATFDETVLAGLLSGLEEDLAGTGFSDADLEALLAESPARPVPATTDSEDLQAKWSTEAGQVWQLGRHRVACGDATDEALVERLMAGTTVDVILTDPPYCAGGFQERGKGQGSIGTSARDDAGKRRLIANDTLSSRGYQSLIRQTIGPLDAAMVYVFTDWRMWVYLFDVVESLGFGVRNMIVWDKGSPGMGYGWRAQHELVMCGTKATGLFDKKAGKGNVVSLPRSGNQHHLTEKPVELIETLLQVAPAARVVADPFLGSGTTLLACERLRRTCLGVELDPKYVATTLERWNVMTGEVPELMT